MYKLACIARKVCCFLLSAVFIFGCGSKEDSTPSTPVPAPAPKTLIASANPKPGEVALPPMEVLYEQWMNAATSGDINIDTQKLSVIAGLVGQYEGGYGLFLDLIANPDEDPHLKMLAATSMSQFVFPEDTARLVEMTQAELDATTRACAAHLLSSIPEPEQAGKDRLKELMQDESVQIRVATVLALAARGDIDAINSLNPLWKEDGLNPSQRTSILLSLPDAGPEVYRDMYLDAVQMQDLSTQLRLNLIEQLSLLSDEEVKSVLEKIGADDPDEEVRLMAQGAAAAIEARTEAPLDSGSGGNN